MQYKMLDLCCCAGGAAVGYSRAGFSEIVGVDISPQKNYPFEFMQADVLTLDYFNSPPKLEAVLELIKGSLRYLSLKDTITACRSCAYKMDHPEMFDLCPLCKKRHKKIKYSKCFECQNTS